MTEGDNFCLRWTNFPNNLSEGFHSLLEEVDLVDVTLAADGQYLQAHKLVLSICSPYFRQLFKVNPCKHPIVILKDVCYKDVEALLQFMYKGEVNVRQEELAPFLKTAEMLQIKGLAGNYTESNDLPMPSVQPLSPIHRTAREAVRNADNLSPSETSRSYKRLRTDCSLSGSVSLPTPAPPPPPPPPPPPVPTPPSAQASHSMSVSTSKTAPPSPSQENNVEYLITNPKPEPIEFKDVEDDDSSTDLVQLLHGGETSRPLPDIPPGPPPVYSAVPGLSHEPGGPQDSLQGPPASERKIMQAMHHELYLSASRGRCTGRLRKRCVHCYEANRRMLGCRLANLKTLKVSTFCGTCAKFPFMCVNCFKLHVLEKRDFLGEVNQ